MAEVSIRTSFNVDLDFETAPFHKRLFAYCLDFLILISYLYVLKYLLYQVFRINPEQSMGLDILIVSMPMLFYSLITEVKMHGQTVGKKLMQIRVVSIDGGEPTIGQFILRWITKFFEWPFLFGYTWFSSESVIFYVFVTSLLGIGVIIPILFTKNNQRLGDLAAGTTVVNTITNLNINDTIFMDVNFDNYQPSFPQVMKLSDRDINKIRSIIIHSQKYGNDFASIMSEKVKTVLNLTTELPPVELLEKLMEDYNYLATKE